VDDLDKPVWQNSLDHLEKGGPGCLSLRSPIELTSKLRLA